MIYLDNASTSWPKPPAVETKTVEALRGAGNPGRGHYRLAEAAAEIVEGARGRLARLLGAPSPDCIALAFNATDALNMAIKGVLGSGGHVITTDLEHNSVLRPLSALHAAGRIGLTHVGFDARGYVDPAEIVEALCEDTRLVAVTHASNVLGSVQPVAEIARRLRASGSGALLLVDASQTAGVSPIHVELDRVDLVAGSGHKGLLGPTGTGFLYVAPHVTLGAWREGGTGSASASLLHPDRMPALLEAGTPNVCGLAGLVAGLDFIEERGRQSLFEGEIELAERLLAGLERLPKVKIHGPGADRPRVAVVSITIADYDPTEAAAVLDSSFGIAVRAGLHCAPRCHARLGTAPEGTIRLSPGPFTEQSEIDAAIEAIAAL